MDNWEATLISEAEFVDAWGATTKTTGDLYRFEEVRNQPSNQVWTVTDCGGEEPNHWIASPGFHIVNVIGYVITTRPWMDDTPDAFYFFDDIDP